MPIITKANNAIRKIDKGDAKPEGAREKLFCSAEVQLIIILIGDRLKRR